MVAVGVGNDDIEGQKLVENLARHVRALDVIAGAALAHNGLRP